MNSILIVKTSAIGDVIQTFPVLSFLRKQYPNAQIEWVVEAGSSDLLKAHPDLDAVLTIDTKSWKKKPLSFSTFCSIANSIRHLRVKQYDLIIDLQGNLKSAAVTCLARGTVKLGFDRAEVREKGNLLVTNKRISITPGLSSRERYLQLVQRYCGQEKLFSAPAIKLKCTEEELKRLHFLLQIIRKHRSSSTQQAVMICFGSRWKNKQLNPSILVALLERVRVDYNCFYVFIFGNAEEEIEANRLSALFVDNSLAVGALSLPLWQSLMAEMDLVIAVDSAALHLCATTSTPSFSIFGPSSAAIYKPTGPQHHFLQGTCPYGRRFRAICPILRSCPTGACIRDLTVEALYKRFRECLQTLS